MRRPWWWDRFEVGLATVMGPPAVSTFDEQNWAVSVSAIIDIQGRRVPRLLHKLGA